MESERTGVLLSDPNRMFDRYVLTSESSALSRTGFDVYSRTETLGFHLGVTLASFIVLHGLDWIRSLRTTKDKPSGIREQFRSARQSSNDITPLTVGIDIPMYLSPSCIPPSTNSSYSFCSPYGVPKRPPRLRQVRELIPAMWKRPSPCHTNTTPARCSQIPG